GAKKIYWYAWKNGPRLVGEYGSPEFIASYNAAIATKVGPPAGRLLALLQGYQKSQDFLGLRDRKSTRLNSSHSQISYAVFCLKSHRDHRDLHSFPTRRSSDLGAKKIYWYAWKNGPRLVGEYGSPEFIASYNAAIATKVGPPAGRLLALLQGYQKSQDFLGL